MASVSSSEARATLPELLTRVEGGEEITITRHRRAVAVVVRPDALRSRRAQAVLEVSDRLHDLLQATRAQARPTSRGLTKARAEELAAAVDNDRGNR